MDPNSSIFTPRPVSSDTTDQFDLGTFPSFESMGSFGNGDVTGYAPNVN